MVWLLSPKYTHKAKGKEFDNVFLLLENFDLMENKNKRQLYVAMTRARQNLTIHTNNNDFNLFRAENLEKLENNDVFQSPSILAIHLSHKDLNLGYFDYVQNQVNELKSGDRLIISNNGCKNSKGELVLKFSKKFLERLEEIKKDGFELKEANVNFIIYWIDNEKKIELKIILPELCFEKNSLNEKEIYKASLQ